MREYNLFSNYMPYEIRKLPNKPLFRVYNKLTKAIHSKATTMPRAESQVRLLNAIDHGFKPGMKRA